LTSGDQGRTVGGVTDDLAPRSSLQHALGLGREVAAAGSGGDAACWLDRVCAECGLLVDGPVDVCPRCGTPVATSGA